MSAFAVTIEYCWVELVINDVRVSQTTTFLARPYRAAAQGVPGVWRPGTIKALAKAKLAAQLETSATIAQDDRQCRREGVPAAEQGKDSDRPCGAKEGPL